jgi:hypothetical protein
LIASFADAQPPAGTHVPPVIIEPCPAPLALRPRTVDLRVSSIINSLDRVAQIDRSGVQGADI